MNRREFLKLMGAVILVGAASIGYDVTVNEGHPAQEGEDDDEPPH